MDKAGIVPLFSLTKEGEKFMSIFKPNYFFDKIWDIELSFLKKNNIKCLLLDVDNTLTYHDAPDPHEKAVEWLNMVRNEGIISVVISNNIEERVAPFSKLINAEYVFHAQKPLSRGVKEAVKLTGICENQMLMIGDQIFTDVLCGKFSGVKTVLVEPFELEDMPFFKVKRFLERIIITKKKRKQK